MMGDWQQLSEDERLARQLQAEEMQMVRTGPALQAREQVLAPAHVGQLRQYLMHHQRLREARNAGAANNANDNVANNNNNNNNNNQIITKRNVVFVLERTV
eukprot:TRINITY_DN65842_c6_g5_i1.p2 TRINITY_DN65842_c6_g5~~TRINITY_DN65842_c6_g5_i1.p2  ORF type:complete len:101 (-),score=56.17 TRINITY_DN65842_c6_g5_i1:202-504(-)